MMEAVATDTSLTQEQVAAREEILSLLGEGKEYVSLKGYAGTGKTYLASHLIGELSYRSNVYATAPTHKATAVLNEKIPIEASTIHSFLGLNRVQDGKGGYVLVKNKNAKVPETGIVIVDEASMLGSVLWQYITEHDHLQWLFVGDPAQLSPVREHPSPALDTPGPTLEKIVRQQADNPILQLSSEVRQGAKLYLKSPSAYNGNMGVVSTTSQNSFLKSALGVFSNDDPLKPPTARVLSYTNRQVRYYNDTVRAHLYGTQSLPRIVKGDWLMMRETFFEEKEMVCKNSEEVRVLRATPATMYLAGQNWDIHQTTVLRSDGSHAILPILQNSEIKRRDREVARLKKLASDGKRGWKSYYRLKEGFADVDYAFSLTVHKAQGSTFETAYVDVKNFQKCRNPRERRALSYVAVTRPARRLALLI